MGAETYGMIATAGYALALALAAAAIVMFFVLHIREVRDELTGKSARRAIEEMREGRRGTIRVAGAAAVGASGAGTAVPGEGSGSLHVREVAARGEKTGATGRRRSGRTGSTVASRPHAGTTASVGAPAPGARPCSQATRPQAIRLPPTPPRAVPRPARPCSPRAPARTRTPRPPLPRVIPRPAPPCSRATRPQAPRRSPTPRGTAPRPAPRF